MNPFTLRFMQVVQLCANMAAAWKRLLPFTYTVSRAFAQVGEGARDPSLSLRHVFRYCNEVITESGFRVKSSFELKLPQVMRLAGKGGQHKCDSTCHSRSNNPDHSLAKAELNSTCNVSSIPKLWNLRREFGIERHFSATPAFMTEIAELWSLLATAVLITVSKA